MSVVLFVSGREDDGAQWLLPSASPPFRVGAEVGLPRVAHGARGGSSESCYLERPRRWFRPGRWTTGVGAIVDTVANLSLVPNGAAAQL
jgi:hypothetical protein